MIKLLLKLSRDLPLFLLFVSLLAPACVSRYRLDLYQSIDEIRRKTKVVESLFVEGVVIGDPMADAKLDLGPANCIVLTTSTRGKQLETDPSQTLFLGFFENLRCKVYLELPTHIKAETIPLVNNSLVQMLGRYELPLEDKIFLPVDGNLIVDSVVDARTLFGEINGRFVNYLGQEIGYEGRFKVKIAN